MTVDYFRVNSGFFKDFSKINLHRISYIIYVIKNAHFTTLMSAMAQKNVDRDSQKRGSDDLETGRQKTERAKAHSGWIKWKSWTQSLTTLEVF